MNRIGFAIGSLLIAATSAAGQTSADLTFCASLKSSKERLACYDAAARIEKSASKQAIQQSASLSALQGNGAPAQGSENIREVAPGVRSTFDGAYVAAFGGYAPALDAQSRFGLISHGRLGGAFGYNVTAGSLLFGGETRLQTGIDARRDEHHEQSVGPFFPRLPCCGPVRPEEPVGSMFTIDNKFEREFGGDLSVRFGATFADWLVFSRLGAGAQFMQSESLSQFFSLICVAPVTEVRGTTIIVGCGSIRPDFISAVKTGGRGWVPYTVLGAGIERNFGSFFVRAEVELEAYLGVRIANQATSNFFSVVPFYTAATNLGVGYRF